MKKIISLFKRNYDGDRLVRNEVVEGAEWVLNGEGVATQKLDGTCCLIRGGKLYKRYDAKVHPVPDGNGGFTFERSKPLPLGFEPAQEPDPVTGHWPGWLLVADKPEDRYYNAAWQDMLYDLGENEPLDGTYELCGPKIQSTKGEPNPENLNTCRLLRHNSTVLENIPRDYDGLREYFRYANMEGIVFWRDLKDQDCDKVKIKGKDFGFKREYGD